MEIKFDEAGISGGAGVDAVEARSKPVLAQLVASSPYHFTSFILYVLYATPAFFGPAIPSKPSARPTRLHFALEQPAIAKERLDAGRQEKDALAQYSLPGILSSP